MLCKICGEVNSKFALKCKSCGAFLQNPIRVLNLFETIGKLILTPTEAFHKIILSERKNFSLLLASLFGIAITFDIFHFAKVGENFENLIFILFYIIPLGVVFGIVIVFLISLAIKFLVAFVREKVNFKSIFATVAYSLFPLAFSVFFLLPTILAVFGIYYFTESPKPENLKPIPFYILSFLGLFLKIYSAVLISVAFKHITGNFVKGFLFAILTSIYVLILLNLLTEVIKLLL